MPPLKGSLEEKRKQALDSVLRKTTFSAAWEEESRARVLHRMATAKQAVTGKLIAEEGVFVGRYEPRDADGASLGKIFNIFAAPEDLPVSMTYNDTLRHLDALKSWHGHDGTAYPAERDIVAALKDGSYGGGWVIPPRDVLFGAGADNLLDCKDRGSFQGTYRVEHFPPGSGNPTDSYWSSTEHTAGGSLVWKARFSDGVPDVDPKDYVRRNCRPVRFVPVMP